MTTGGGPVALPLKPEVIIQENYPFNLGKFFHFTYDITSVKLSIHRLIPLQANT